MVENPYRVGKTQWSKWNDAGRVAFNEARDAGASYTEAGEAAAVATRDAEEERKAKKRGLLDVVGDVVADVADVAATVSGVAAAVAPVVSVAKAVTKPRAKKGK